MKIWRVTTYDNAHAWYHFGTKKEADAEARKFRRDLADDGFDDASVEVEAVEVQPTRVGIAAALQDFVDQTCINEH